MSARANRARRVRYGVNTTSSLLIDNARIQCSPIQLWQIPRGQGCSHWEEKPHVRRITGIGVIDDAPIPLTGSALVSAQAYDPRWIAGVDSNDDSGMLGRLLVAWRKADSYGPEYRMTYLDKVA